MRIIRRAVDPSLSRKRGLIYLYLGCCLLIAMYEFKFPLLGPNINEPTAPHKFTTVRTPQKDLKSSSTPSQKTTSVQDIMQLSTKKRQSIDTVEDLIKKKGFIVFTGTRYSSTDDVRFRTCLNLIAQCLESDTPLVIVDSSQNQEVIEVLKASGALVYRQVQEGGKGTSLREGAAIASRLPGVDPDKTFLCFQEPEKVDMVRHWPGVVDVRDDILMPYRSLPLFEETYASEEFNSELYGNLYLDAAAKEGLGKLNQEFLPLIDERIARDMSRFNRNIHRMDWFFGPFATKAKHVNLWTDYTRGGSYDSQLVPLVHAMRNGISFSSVHVKYEASLYMKQQEEENMVFIEKRLSQLNEVVPRVVQAWSEESYL